MEELFQLALKALHGGMSPADVDALIQEDTNGSIASLDALKTHLNQQDMAGQGTFVEKAGGQALPFLDRIGGALDALGTVLPSPGFGVPRTPGGIEDAKAAYLQGRDIARSRNAAYTREHPHAAIAADIVGGVGGALAGSAALKGLGFLATAAKEAPTVLSLARTGAVAGAGMGALQGVSQTLDLTDVLQTGRDALTSAGAGALAGGAFGAATKPIAAIARGLPRFLTGLIDPAAANEAATFGRLSTVLPPSTSASVARLEASRPGTPMLADADRGATLDAAVRRAPGQAEDVQAALAARTEGAGSRLAGQAEQAAGAPGANAVEAQAAVQAARAPFREATYKALETAHPDVIPTPALEKALALPEVASVLPNAAQEGMPEVAPLSFQRMQTALQLLRQKREAIFSGRAIGDPQPLVEAYNALESGMEEAMPRFRAANRGWAEGSHALDAFDLGRKALSKDSRVITQELADLGTGTVGEEARNAYRLAALDQYTSRLRNLAPGRSAGLKALRQGDQVLEGRLRSLFGDSKEMDQFFQSAEAERWLQQTQQSLTGSKTQGRTALDESLFGPRTAGGRLWRKLASWVQKDAGSAADEAQASRYITALTSQGPELQRVLAGIEAQRAAAGAARDALPAQAAGLGMFGGTRSGKETAAGAGIGGIMLAPHQVVPGALRALLDPTAGAH